MKKKKGYHDITIVFQQEILMLADGSSVHYVHLHFIGNWYVNIPFPPLSSTHNSTSCHVFFLNSSILLAINWVVCSFIAIPCSDSTRIWAGIKAATDAKVKKSNVDLLAWLSCNDPGILLWSTSSFFSYYTGYVSSRMVKLEVFGCTAPFSRQWRHCQNIKKIQGIEKHWTQMFVIRKFYLEISRWVHVKVIYNFPQTSKANHYVRVGKLSSNAAIHWQTDMVFFRNFYCLKILSLFSIL